MSDYSNYLGAKKCCAKNLATTVTGPEGPKGSQGAIGPIGYQGFTGSTGPQGATGACCRGPQGYTGAQGTPGIAGGNGGLPLFLNYTIDGVTNTSTGITSPFNATDLTYKPAIQAQQTSVSGMQVYYDPSQTWTQDFITTISYTSTQSIPAGFYTLYLYAFSAPFLTT
jgi:hypothetical protein